MTGSVPTRTTKFCHHCGYVIDAGASSCVRCGEPQGAVVLATESDKRLLPTSLLCLVLGVFGAHRFYAGKTGTGLLQLLTAGGLGLWWLYDLIMVLTGSFRDADGERITEWV